MRVLICEKPSQAKDIASVIGIGKREHGFYVCKNGDRITWCFGHMLQLAAPDTYERSLKPWRMEILPVVPDQWIMEKNKKTKQQLSIIVSLVKKTNHVIVATDADREGEVIAREILDSIKYNGRIDRLWLSALDEKSIKHALDNIRPGKATEGLYLAGLGRSRADWLMGMNMTMAATVLFSKPKEGVQSVGRVQTPTLALVVQRDLEIECFKPKPYFDVIANFSHENTSFQLKWKAPEDSSDDSGRCLDEKLAKEVTNKVIGKKGLVDHFSDIEKSTAAPLPFSLSDLQKRCSSQFGFSAKETLSIAQSLYENHKATTYPRTDCGYLPTSQFSDVEDILGVLSQNGFKKEVNFCNMQYKSKAWDDKKVTAHHGIIPTTKKDINLDLMSDKELKVYQLICRHYIAQFLGDYTFVLRSIKVNCQGHFFSAKTAQTKNKGWKLVLNDSKGDCENNLPFLKEREHVHCLNAQVESKKTTPPPRYTEGTLIGAMKNVAKIIKNAELKRILKKESGIGTEATRADIIEKLCFRGYLERNKKKQLISTERGRYVISIVPDAFKDPGTTALWEQQLDGIASGEGSLNDFISGQQNVLYDAISLIKEHPEANNKKTHIYTCNICFGNMVRRDGKYGMWWGCCNFPKCKNTLKDRDGMPVLPVEEKR